MQKGKAVMSSGIEIGALADTVMKELDRYSELTTEGMKAAVMKAGKSVRKEIKASAPSKSGAYAKSWSVKKTKENANALEVTVHSRNRYQLAHLLEFGHAKRNGGRTAAKPHIAPAEQLGIELFEEEIERCLRNG